MFLRAEITGNGGDSVHAIHDVSTGILGAKSGTAQDFTGMGRKESESQFRSYAAGEE